MDRNGLMDSWYGHAYTVYMSGFLNDGIQDMKQELLVVT